MLAYLDVPGVLRPLSAAIGYAAHLRACLQALAPLTVDLLAVFKKILGVKPAYHSIQSFKHKEENLYSRTETRRDVQHKLSEQES